MGQHPKAIWVILGANVFLTIMILLGQTTSFINYDFAVSLKLQEAIEVVGPITVAWNKGFGIADTFIYIPLLVLGIIGLCRNKLWGLLATGAALGITAYWPLVSICALYLAKGTPGFHFTNYTPYTVLCGTWTLYGVWGLAILYKHRATYNR